MDDLTQELPPAATKIFRYPAVRYKSEPRNRIGLAEKGLLRSFFALSSSFFRALAFLTFLGTHAPRTTHAAQ